jgi:hypothetical protein
MTTYILLKGMDKLAHGASFHSPAMNLSYHVTNKMFVNNITNYTNDFPWWLHLPTDREIVTSWTKHDAQIWTHLLWTSSGLLNLSKCLFYLITCGTLTKKAEPHLLLQRLTSRDNTKTDPIIQHDCQEAHCMLSARINPALKMTKAYKVIMATSTLYACQITSSALNHWEAWMHTSASSPKCDISSQCPIPLPGHFKSYNPQQCDPHFSSSTSAVTLP